MPINVTGMFSSLSTWEHNNNLAFFLLVYREVTVIS